MKIISAVLVMSVILVMVCSAQTRAPRYAVAVIPAPVLNTADFPGVFGGPDGKTLRLDPSGLIREVEFIALPGTPFRIEESFKQGGRIIYRVSTDDYPYPTKKGYFIDSRFVSLADVPPPQRPRHLPSRQQVIDNLLAARGSRYVWGGNLRAGIPQLLSYYPPAAGHNLSPATAGLWQLRGVDCSGLLYEATGGFTPRNTSALVSYGKPVPIKGLDAGEIAKKVEPLDLIVWSGHVMIVFDRERIIESVPDSGGNGGGVRVRPLREALAGLLKARLPLDDYAKAAGTGAKGFVIRRWYPAGE